MIKKIALLLLCICFTVTIFAEDVVVTTPDGPVIIYKGDLETTSQIKGFSGLYDGINQCRIYTKLAEEILSEGLNELQTSVDVLFGEDIIFPSISLPPSTENNSHNLVMQCLGPVQDGKRQVTFSTDIVIFDIKPNVTTSIDLELYLTKLTVKTILDSNYLTRGGAYKVETLGNNVVDVTLDPDETAFTLTYEVGDQPKSIISVVGDSIANVVYNSSFGNVATENLSLTVNNGNINISAAFIVGEVIMSSPGLLVNDLPDSNKESKVYNFNARGLTPGDYNVIVTVDNTDDDIDNGIEVEYPINITVGNGVTIPATTGRIDSHTIFTLGEVMSLGIDFTPYYEDISSGSLTDPEVRLFFVKGGEI